MGSWSSDNHHSPSLPRRTTVAIVLLVIALGFAPAPVFRERPDPTGLLRRMQGTWELTTSVRAGVHRSTLVRIKGSTWTYVFVTNGDESEGTPTEIHLGADRDLATLDLELRNPGPGDTRCVLRGIVKLEGKLLSVCHSPARNASRPTTFAGARPWVADSADKDISPWTMILRKRE